jgi:hypothetical protein
VALASDSVGYTIIGSMGAALILLGFYRTSIGRWTNKSIWYELDNLIGALLLIVYQLHIRNYISLVLEIVWAVVAFRGVTSLAERYEKERHSRKRRRT